MLRKLALTLAGPVEDGLKRILERRLASSLAKSKSLSFSQDYVSGFASDWNRFLSHLRGKEGVAFLEIGCFEGRATLWFLENILTHHSATITCIDSFTRMGGESRFDHNIGISGHARKTIKIRGQSENALPELAPENFDAVYIDGSHLAVDVLMDAVASWRLLKPGGTMIFDDYGWDEHRPAAHRPQRAIDLFIDTMGPRVDVLHHAYQVIVRKTID